MTTPDYYEFLQISPHADQETIHRVYRFLAARYHPDNPESGDAEKFSILTTAYDALSDGARRAEYDAALERRPHETAAPLSNSIDFMDSVAGEMNRRLAVLAVLYSRRRTSPLGPEVSLAEVETRMGFPRDYLDFTTWYLQKKGYITRADNSDFTLTAEGVDFVETQRVRIPALNKLLTDGAENAGADGETTKRLKTLHPGLIVLPDRHAAGHSFPFVERRVNKRDRRANAEGRRSDGTDPRADARDRRADPFTGASHPQNGSRDSKFPVNCAETEAADSLKERGEAHRQ